MLEVERKAGAAVEAGEAGASRKVAVVVGQEPVVLHRI